MKFKNFYFIDSFCVAEMAQRETIIRLKQWAQ